MKSRASEHPSLQNTLKSMILQNLSKSIKIQASKPPGYPRIYENHQKSIELHENPSIWKSYKPKVTANSQDMFHIWPNISWISLYVFILECRRHWPYGLYNIITYTWHRPVVLGSSIICFVSLFYIPYQICIKILTGRYRQSEGIATRWDQEKDEMLSLHNLAPWKFVVGPDTEDRNAITAGFALSEMSQASTILFCFKYLKILTKYAYCNEILGWNIVYIETSVNLFKNKLMWKSPGL